MGILESKNIFKTLILLLSFVLFGCIASKKNLVTYNELENTSIIKLINKNDSIKLLGKWEKYPLKINNNNNFYRNNDDVLSINIQKIEPKYDSILGKKVMLKNSEILSREIAHSLSVSEYFNIKITLLETDYNNYDSFKYFDKKINDEVLVFIGVKNDNLISINMINPKKDSKQKINFIIQLYNYLAI